MLLHSSRLLHRSRNQSCLQGVSDISKPYITCVVVAVLTHVEFGLNTLYFRGWKVHALTDRTVAYSVVGSVVTLSQASRLSDEKVSCNGHKTW